MAFIVKTMDFDQLSFAANKVQMQVDPQNLTAHNVPHFNNIYVDK